MDLVHIKYWYENAIIPNDLYVNSVEYDDVSYKRNVLYRNDDIEILLICWMPGQKTPVHVDSFKFRIAYVKDPQL